ncbi:MAG: amidohydrolase [Clostridiales Family XIII bacterium]|nr:amidohydrolase [Clostridiales Family XIII bacterium]
MLFKDVTMIGENEEIIRGAYVGVKGKFIEYVGTEAPREDFGRVHEGRGRLLMPGFYNAHAHSPMTLLRGYGENLRLHEWLHDRMFPFEAKLYGEAVYWGTLLAMAESMRFGVVSTTDMYDFGEESVKAVLESGLKVNFGRPVICFGDEDIYGLKSFREAMALLEGLNGAGDGRVVIDLSLHAEYTSTEKTVRQLAEARLEKGAGMHVHVAETEQETRGCAERHGGKTPVAYLAGLGLFEGRTTAAHCVWLTEEDMGILAEKGVDVATCPVSNMKLASGVCDVPALLAKGVNVAIGTDGVASNNSLNYIEEMKFFALANKSAKGDPTLISPAEAVRAATLAGARSQGRRDCGLIKVGYRADLAVLDISAPNMRPVHNLLNNVVYSASGGDVLLTMADGAVVYEKGEYLTLDVERVAFEAEKATEKILGELS